MLNLWECSGPGYNKSTFRKIYMAYNETPTKGKVMSPETKDLLIFLAYPTGFGMVGNALLRANRKVKKLENTIQDMQIDMKHANREASASRKRTVDTGELLFKRHPELRRVIEKMYTDRKFEEIMEDNF